MQKGAASRAQAWSPSPRAAHRPDWLQAWVAHAPATSGSGCVPHAATPCCCARLVRLSKTETVAAVPGGTLPPASTATLETLARLPWSMIAHAAGG